MLGYKMVTVSIVQKENKLSNTDWNLICFYLASSVKYMRLKNLLHDDLKSNNVLLKLRNNVWIPKLTDMGEVTLKSNPETYKQSNTQKDLYNKNDLYKGLCNELFPLIICLNICIL